MLTIRLTSQEQQSFLLAARRVQAIVKEKTPTTVVMEPYKVAYLDSKGNNNVFFYGNEYWNPVCAADSYLAPFSTDARQVVWSPTSGYGYDPPLPDTYTTVLAALQSKNSQNDYPMALIDSLPSSSAINVEWPDSFHAYNVNSNVAAYNLKNFIVAQDDNNFRIPAGSKPITLCDSPAAMKMLGFGPSFNQNGHTIDDINSPAYNPYVTLSGTDGAVVIPDFTTMPPQGSPSYFWIYDDNDPSVISTQLPKVFFEKSVNYLLPKQSCNDPRSCVFPKGANPGVNLVGTFDHEINHIMGVMSSQYYKVPYEGTALSYVYGTALYLLDLFDLDSDDIAPSYVGFSSARRNNNTSGPNTVRYGSPGHSLTPWIQWGYHDHLMTYAEDSGIPQYFPLMNYSQYNPDGDIQFQNGYFDTYTTQWNRRAVFVDPLLSGMPDSNVVRMNAQAASFKSTIDVMTVREYSELSASGWNVDYSTLSDPYNTTAPTWKWYQTCFDSNGNFTTAKNKNCKYSVTPDDLQFLN